MQASQRLELGVIGYQARTVMPAEHETRAPAAWLPSMMICPVGQLGARSVNDAFCLGRFSRAHS